MGQSRLEDTGSEGSTRRTTTDQKRGRRERERKESQKGKAARGTNGTLIQESPLRKLPIQNNTPFGETACSPPTQKDPSYAHLFWCFRFSIIFSPRVSNVTHVLFVVFSFLVCVLFCVVAADEGQY
eukprot:Hpha_TRINITY_DN16213_c0_g1::TRINITY_DN16213_c0_g1_i1::g.13142::m.13142